MQNSHQVFWEFYNGATARYGHQKSGVSLQNTTMLDFYKCLPLWEKVPKTFKKKVCSETSKKMTFFKSDHRISEIRSKRK